MTDICISKLTIIGSDNGLLRGQRQAIIRTNAGIFLIGPLGTNFSEILIEIHIFSFNKMHLKMSYAKCPSFCLGLSVLKYLSICEVNRAIAKSVQASSGSGHGTAAVLLPGFAIN